MSKIIILRGNSGSGKTTVGKALQKKIGHGTLLLSQDVVRREMIYVKDEPNNKAIDLLQNLVIFAHEQCSIAILEGILYTDYYVNLFKLIEEIYTNRIYAYYFDLPFEETLKRHLQKPNANEFGEVEMRRWFRDKDCLYNINETLLSKEMSEKDIIDKIYNDVILTKN